MKCDLCGHDEHEGMMCLAVTWQGRTAETCQCLSHRFPTDEEVADLKRRYGVMKP